MQVLFKLLSEN